MKITVSIKFVSLCLLIVTSFLLSAALCQAENTMPDSIMGSKELKECAADGSCGLNDFVDIGIVVSRILVGLSGSAALLAFVAGGIMLMLSGGNKTWVDRGKATITGAIIGLVIVLASWVIIGLVITTVADDNSHAENWFQSDWFSK